jgi:hypothetical protein
MRTTTHPLWQTLTRDSWSVAINTHRGACQSGLRYGMQILNGHVVSAAGGAAYVRGIVNPGGAVRVSVQSGGQWANGSGRLGVATGGGVWHGQGNAGPCSGTWSAQRMTSQVAAGQMPQAAEQMPGRPIYNYARNYAPAYAPNYAPRYYRPASPGAPVYYYAPQPQQY